MKKYINDITDLSAFTDELDKIQCITTGHDKPRYIDVARGQTGDLGYTPWPQFYYKPTYNSDVAGGSLNSAKYYAIRLVPVDTDIAANFNFIKGTPSGYSTPRVPVGGGTDTIRFNLVDHFDTTTYDTGDETAGTASAATDTSKSWSTDQWIGYDCKNVETGVTANITANSASVLTLDADLALGVDDRFQIVLNKTDHYEVYAAEVTAALDITGSVWYYQGDVDYGTATYDLTSFVSSILLVTDEYFPPENFRYCHTAFDRLFAGGGVEESRGKAQVNVTTETKQATATVNEDIVVTVTSELYSGATDDRIIRYTLGSALSAFTAIYAGSFVTVTNSGTAGNDITAAQVLRVASDNTWFELENNEGVADASDVAMTIVMTPNVVEGNTSGADQTYFRQGHVNATIQLSGDASVYTILSVDEINQTLMLTALYTGSQTSDVYIDITSDYDLYYSDVRNPHIFRSANFIEIADRIIAFHAYGGFMVVFCQSSLWSVPLDNLGARATQISDQIDFNAPYSVVYTPKGIFFWDGYGFSITDGRSLTSVTKYRANEYLDGLNREQAYNIRGVYDRRNTRVEYSFAYGSDVTNNYGLIITIDSLNCYGIARTDVNALWTDKDTTGEINVYHGTSGRHTTSGEGVVWEHDEDLPTDGDIGTAAYMLTVDSVTDQKISVTSAAGITDGAEGWPILYLPAAGGTPRQMVIEAITSTGTSPQTYDIDVSTDFQVDDIADGDYIFVGGIPIDYGPKWTDFSSPQYQHKVREIQLDTNGFRGILFVDHYIDSKDIPVQTDVRFLTSDDTHYVVPYRGSSSNTYALRLRGVTVDKMKLMSTSILFDSEV